jgi:hypothetical protein
MGFFFVRTDFSQVLRAGHLIVPDAGGAEESKVTRSFNQHQERGTMMAPETTSHIPVDEPSFPPGELAESRLRCNSYLALKNVACEYRDGVLVLRGQVPTYYLKQVAHATVAGLSGVRHVVNEIDVGIAAASAERPSAYRR